MTPDTWAVFHDGVIRGVTGHLDNSVMLKVQIEYLRHMFDIDGDGFLISLGNCDKVEFTEFGEQAQRTLIGKEDLNITILYVDSELPLIIDCREGKLLLEYKRMSVSLDSGKTVSYEELSRASDEYWERGWDGSPAKARK